MCIRDSTNDYVTTTGYQGVSGADPRTVEAWIKTTSNDKGIVGWGTNISGQKMEFRIQSQNGTSGAIRVEVNGGYIVGDTPVNDGKWHHVAYTFPGGSLNKIDDITLFVDGQPQTISAKLSCSIATVPQTDVLIGKGITSPTWSGQISEVRIWDKVRNVSDIQETMNRRLTGNEGGLLLYYTFDEKNGSVTADQSSHDHIGILQGSPRWQDAGFTLQREIAVTTEKEAEVIASQAAPIIDHVGRRTVIGGLSARLYYQQEAAATGYDGQSKPMKKNARVMLSTPTIAGDQPESAALTTVDFAVSRHGRLAQTPDALTLPILQRPQHAGDAHTISQLEGAIRGLSQEIERLSDEVETARAAVSNKGSLQVQKYKLETALPSLRTQLTQARDNPRNYWHRLQIKANGKYFMQNPGHKDRIIQTSDVNGADQFKFTRRSGKEHVLTRRKGMDLWVHNDDYLGLSSGGFRRNAQSFWVTFHGRDEVSFTGMSVSYTHLTLPTILRV